MNPEKVIKRITELMEQLEKDNIDLKEVKVFVNSKPGGNKVRKIFYDPVTNEIIIE